MKKLFYVPAAFLLLLTSCKNASKTEMSTSTTSMESNKANSKTVYSAIETGDVGKLDSVIDVNFVDHMEGREVKGIDSVKKMIGDIHNHFSNLKMDLIANGTDGDYSMALVRMTGTPTDGMMGFPANKPIDMMSVDVVKTNSAGKAVEHWAFVDPQDMMNMMANEHAGMMPGKMDDKMMDKKMDKMAMDSMKKK
ncbi:MAG: ester cyclase [Ferruginibacter sp.]